MNSVEATVAMAVLLLVTCAFVPAGLAGARGAGDQHHEDRSVAEFTGIALLSAADVDVTIGAHRSVTIRGETNVLPLVTTAVHDGVLEIGCSKPLVSKSRVHVTIVTPHLTSVALKGAGKITVAGLDEDRFEVSLGGAGDIVVSGATKKLSASLDGAGRLGLYGLESSHATASLNGTGKLELNASDGLVATLNGVGSIRYKGKPSVSASRNGIGSIGPG